LDHSCPNPGKKKIMVIRGMDRAESGGRERRRRRSDLITRVITRTQLIMTLKY